MADLLLALTYHQLGQPDRARSLYHSSVAWLDRYRMPIWIVTGSSLARDDLIDPRYRPDDWESWHEADILRKELSTLVRPG